jgi:hypothetical protein
VSAGSSEDVVLQAVFQKQAIYSFFFPLPSPNLIDTEGDEELQSYASRNSVGKWTRSLVHIGGCPELSFRVKFFVPRRLISSRLFSVHFVQQTATGNKIEKELHLILSPSPNIYYILIYFYVNTD